jgi:hypothetical protein
VYSVTVFVLCNGVIDYVVEITMVKEFDASFVFCNIVIDNDIEITIVKYGYAPCVVQKDVVRDSIIVTICRNSDAIVVLFDDGGCDGVVTRMINFYSIRRRLSTILNSKITDIDPIRVNPDGIAVRQLTTTIYNGRILIFTNKID